MTYKFKPLPELYWGVIIAVSLVLLQALFTLDPGTVADWQTWAVAIGGAAIRAGAGAALDYLRRSMTAETEPTLADEILALSDTDLAALRVELAQRRQQIPSPPLPPPPMDRDAYSDVRP